MPEARKSPRTDVSLYTQLVVDGETVSVQIRNLSLGGACVFSQHFFSSATDVTIALETPSRKLTLLGRTVYSFQCEPGIFRTGIRFQQMTEESRALVTALMKQAK